MLENDNSASAEKMASRKLIVFEYETSLGKALSHILFDKAKVKNLSTDRNNM